MEHDRPSFWAVAQDGSSEAGLTHYEFWQHKTKDITAIDKASRALNLTPVQFSAFWGITDPKRKEPFLQAVDDAIEAADLLGVKKLCVVAGEVVKGMEREAMFDAVVDALKAAAEKVKDHDITLILEPSQRPGRPSPTSSSARRRTPLRSSTRSTRRT